LHCELDWIALSQRAVPGDEHEIPDLRKCFLTDFIEMPVVLSDMKSRKFSARYFLPQAQQLQSVFVVVLSPSVDEHLFEKHCSSPSHLKHPPREFPVETQLSIEIVSFEILRSPSQESKCLPSEKANREVVVADRQI
jgi:hypothetical protein